MYFVDLFYLLICPLGCSILYITLSDLYKIYILKTKNSTSKYITLDQLYNRGLIIGVIVGIWRFILGKPIITYYLNN